MYLHYFVQWQHQIFTVFSPFVFVIVLYFCNFCSADAFFVPKLFYLKVISAAVRARPPRGKLPKCLTLVFFLFFFVEFFLRLPFLRGLPGEDYLKTDARVLIFLFWNFLAIDVRAPPPPPRGRLP